MQESEVAYLSACEALALFRARQLSPVELMQAVIAKAETDDEVINAFTYCYFEEALENAKAAEAIYARKDPEPRALEGLPTAIKDSGHIEGKPTSSGSLTASQEPQDETSPINERVLANGAICHARTATPEFSCAAFTHSRKWGVSRNPWNVDYTPGGSSGGAGAALAAGFTTLATGSDIGGSIRIPASCCGVIGYKPPKGRNPVDAPFNLDGYCHTGPMARSVKDIILLQNVMCGPHIADPTLLHPGLELPYEYSDLKGLKIAWSMDLGFYEVAPSVRRNTMTALAAFEDAGALLEEVDLQWRWGHHNAGITHLRHLFGTSIAPALQDVALLTRYAKEFAEAGLESLSTAYLNSLVMTAQMGQIFARSIEGFDLFICPTTAIPAVAADHDHSSNLLEINGNAVEPLLGWVMTLPFNMLSTHPVISMPSGHDEHGVPTGIQIVAQPYQDARVFQAALGFEKAVGAWYGSKENRPTTAAPAFSKPNQALQAAI